MKPLLTRAEVERQAQASKIAKAERQRKRGVKKVNAKRGGHRFPDTVIPELREWVRRQPCILLDAPSPCRGPVECAHVRSRGASGEDYDNVVPLCRDHHVLQHVCGIRSFELTFGIHLKRIAVKVTAKWLKERP